MAKKVGIRPSKQAKQPMTEGYPLYPEKEDIYKQFDEVEDVDPEDLSHLKETDPDPHNILRGEIPVNEEIMGVDLDVPGAELDDKEEEIGREDEENNYYSIGGEKDLEDQHGEEDV